MSAKRGKPSGGLADKPDLPQELIYLWNLYVDIAKLGDITYSTIKHYCDLFGIELTPFEIRTIIKIYGHSKSSS